MRRAVLLLAALAATAGAWRPGGRAPALRRPSRLGATIDDTEAPEAAFGASSSSGAPKRLKRVPRGARPTVAIIGRPNVGKSSLVNRLCDAGKKGTIAVNEAGVTRDRVYQKAEWCGRTFDVVDTGGLLFEDEEGALFLDEIREQATLALREACACVVVVDGRAGSTRLDDDIARFLRRWPDQTLEVVLAVNKCESAEREAELVADFWPLGLGEPRACSAIHGNGVAEVLDALLPALDASIEAKAAQIKTMDAIDAKPHVNVCFLGRPNVGKSSLLNRFLGPGETRAIVSDVAGTTRDAVDAELDVDGTIFRFVDTAGVRRKARVTKQGTEPEMVARALRTARLADVVLLVVDATQELSDQDAALAQRSVERRECFFARISPEDAKKSDPVALGRPSASPTTAAPASSSRTSGTRTRTRTRRRRAPSRRRSRRRSRPCPGPRSSSSRRRRASAASRSTPRSSAPSTRTAAASRPRR
jgi:GTP-binding protein